jgi:rhodanese-related sulfurtransferase
VSKKSRNRTGYARKAAPAAGPSRTKLYLGIGGAAVAVLAVVVLAAAVVLGSSGGGSTPAGQSVVHTAAGNYTNVTPDRLSEMLQDKDFTFLNVKTPYIGEIDGTDLYIPYDQLQARAAELPPSKGAKILVYCRSGNESAQAAQILLGMGYTNIWNLDGGMEAWTASGRTLVNKNRT